MRKARCVRAAARRACTSAGDGPSRSKRSGTAGLRRDSTNPVRVSTRTMPGAARCVGRYELIRRLGRGGMGVVHLARDPQDGREVAIKELALGLLDDPAAMRRFAREAAVVASLRHPHIVIAHELLWHDGVPSIVMEYLPGGSLRARVGRLTAGEAAEVLTGVLAGLGHAHAHGIVHRDLKPENLLFGDDDRVRIADFGIAKAAGDTLHSAPSGVLGSPVYLAPEQAAGGEVGPWTDLYAIGVIAYELFVGAPPFRGEAFPELLLRHAHSPVPAPRTVRPDLPVALERWLLGLLEKDPRRRPPDAATASHALQAIVGDRADGWRAAPPPAPPMAATTVIRPARKRRSLIARVPRRPAASVAAVAAAVALLIQTDWLGGLERTSVDARFAVRGTRRAASDPVIVGIDRASRGALKARWPVAGGLHARVIDALRRDGARVIVYKVYFPVEGPSPEQDDRLIVAVKRATRHGTAVVLAGGQTMIGG